MVSCAWHLLVSSVFEVFCVAGSLLPSFVLGVFRPVCTPRFTRCSPVSQVLLFFPGGSLCSQLHLLICYFPRIVTAIGLRISCLFCVMTKMPDKSNLRKERYLESWFWGDSLSWWQELKWLVTVCAVRMHWEWMSLPAPLSFLFTVVSTWAAAAHIKVALPVAMNTIKNFPIDAPDIVTLGSARSGQVDSGD